MRGGGLDTLEERARVLASFLICGELRAAIIIYWLEAIHGDTLKVYSVFYCPVSDAAFLYSRAEFERERDLPRSSLIESSERWIRYCSYFVRLK